MKITLSKKMGLCNGVKSSLRIIEQTLKEYPNKQIYLLNKIVHNNFICNGLKDKGITILDDNRSLEEKILSIDDGVIIFSAHGHAKNLDILAKRKNLIIVDATCPKVNYNNSLIKQSIDKGENVIYIGIAHHPETEASLSIDSRIFFIDYKNPNYENINNLNKVIVHNQTTLLQDDLLQIYKEIQARVPLVEIKNDICHSTLERQKSLMDFNDEDFILVIGDTISSNSQRLYDLAKKIKSPSFFVSNLDEIKKIDFSSYKKGFITAGASTPDEIINPIIEYLLTI